MQMVTLCWAAKGGSGTTVVTTTLALESTRPALLVDLAGDVPAVLGMSEPDRPGVTDWLGSGGATTQLDDLLIEIDDVTALLPHRGPRGATTNHVATADARWRELTTWLGDWTRATDGEVWIDAGTGAPPPALAAEADQRWLVTRPCYLSLRRAAAGVVRPTGVVLVDEPGRSLRVHDVERSTAAPVVAQLLIDPKVARAVDAGLLLSRPPRELRRRLRRAAA
jgi:hypothetical protein